MLFFGFTSGILTSSPLWPWHQVFSKLCRTWHHRSTVLSLCIIQVSMSNQLFHNTSLWIASLNTCLNSAHQCRFPGCNQVLVLDGNMKNRRDICAASEAGYVEYKSLPGTIKTGCQLSPLRTSKYCFNHAPRVSKVCVQDSTSTSTSADSAVEEGIVKVLLAKKVTRSSTLYQVLVLYSDTDLATHVNTKLNLALQCLYYFWKGTIFCLLTFLIAEPMCSAMLNGLSNQADNDLWQ